MTSPQRDGNLRIQFLYNDSSLETWNNIIGQELPCTPDISKSFQEENYV